MNNIFFLDVDTQRDFMLPSGALYVPGAERMIPKLRRLFDFARKHSLFILSSVDAHTPDDPEFKDFPPHCVQGTEGQKKIPETLLPRPLLLVNRVLDRNLIEATRKHQQIIVEKQKLDVFTNPAVEKLLRILPQHAVVFGVTTEYCVKMAALGLRRLGIKTAIINDAICSLGVRTGEEAIGEMRSAGAEFVNSDTVLNASAR